MFQACGRPVYCVQFPGVVGTRSPRDQKFRRLRLGYCCKEASHTPPSLPPSSVHHRIRALNRATPFDHQEKPNFPPTGPHLPGHPHVHRLGQGEPSAIGTKTPLPGHGRCISSIAERAGRGLSSIHSSLSGTVVRFSPPAMLKWTARTRVSTQRTSPRLPSGSLLRWSCLSTQCQPTSAPTLAHTSASITAPIPSQSLPV